MPIRKPGSEDLHFRGLGVALVTPFSDDLSIDIQRFREHIEFQIENGVQLLIPAGTTGESVTMSTEEQLLVIQEAVNIANGRAKILAGIGGNNTSEVIGRAQRASELGMLGAGHSYQFWLALCLSQHGEINLGTFIVYLSLDPC